MKIINLTKILPLALIVLSAYSSFSQDIDTTLFEKQQIVYCGRIIIFDGIWMLNDTIRADISVLMSENSKPVTGGYKMGDAVRINDTCLLYVNLIYKAGFVIKNKEEFDYKDAMGVTEGKIILSNVLNVNEKLLKKYADTLEYYHESKYFVGNYMWSMDYMCISTDCFIRIEAVKGNVTSAIEMREGDFLWTGVCLYELTEVSYKAVFVKMK
jgi:hypothetical protein